MKRTTFSPASSHDTEMTDGAFPSQSGSLRQRQRRNTRILLIGIVVLALLSWLGYSLKTGSLPFHRHRVPVADVSISGGSVGTYPLDKPVDIILHGAGNGTNHFVISQGKCAITEASCPDQICVHQGWISQPGETIVCLPNQVVVTIK